MKKLFTILACLSIMFVASAQEKKLLQGFDGGMMIHTGYLSGLTLGGGAMTTLLMTENPSSAWAPIDGTYYHKQGFMAIDPFIGCDFILSKPMHLTLKVDYLCALSESKLLPHGLRVYFGFLFYR